MYVFFWEMSSLIFFFFLGPNPWCLEIPRLGVKSELQLQSTATALQDLSCVCNLHHSSQQRWILNPQSKARYWTCNLMITSWVSLLLSHNGNSLCSFLTVLFGFLLLSYMTFIHILDINPLSFKWFANIFYSVGCLFILLMVSFAVLNIVLLLFFFYFFIFYFLGPHLWHMRFPGLGLNQSCSCRPTPQPWQYRIQAVSATYTTAHGNARSLPHWVRPGMEPTSSWILVRLVSAAPQWELLVLLLKFRCLSQIHICIWNEVGVEFHFFALIYICFSTPFPYFFFFFWWFVFFLGPHLPLMEIPRLGV